MRAVIRFLTYFMTGLSSNCGSSCGMREGEDDVGSSTRCSVIEDSSQHEGAQGQKERRVQLHNVSDNHQIFSMSVALPSMQSSTLCLNVNVHPFSANNYSSFPFAVSIDIRVSRFQGFIPFSTNFQ